MYKNVVKVFSSVSETWPDSHPELAQTADSIGDSRPNHRPYINLVDIFAEQLAKSSDERAVGLSQRPGVRHGLGVLARFYCHQFQGAVANSVPLDVAGSQMHQAISQKNPLSVLADKPNRVMMEHEDSLGLARDRYCLTSGKYDRLANWTGSQLDYDTGLEKELDGRLQYARQNPHEFLERSGRPFNPNGRCPVEKANQLTAISRSVLDICLTDQSLARRTYELGITHC